MFPPRPPTVNSPQVSTAPPAGNESRQPPPRFGVANGAPQSARAPISAKPARHVPAGQHPGGGGSAPWLDLGSDELAEIDRQVDVLASVSSSAFSPNAPPPSLISQNLHHVVGGAAQPQPRLLLRQALYASSAVGATPQRAAPAFMGSSPVAAQVEDYRLSPHAPLPRQVLGQRVHNGMHKNYTGFSSQLPPRLAAVATTNKVSTETLETFNNGGAVYQPYSNQIPADAKMHFTKPAFPTSANYVNNSTQSQSGFKPTPDAANLAFKPPQTAIATAAGAKTQIPPRQTALNSSCDLQTELNRRIGEVHILRQKLTELEDRLHESSARQAREIKARQDAHQARLASLEDELANARAECAFLSHSSRMSAWQNSRPATAAAAQSTQSQAIAPRSSAQQFDIPSQLHKQPQPPLSLVETSRQAAFSPASSVSKLKESPALFSEQQVTADAKLGTSKTCVPILAATMPAARAANLPRIPVKRLNNEVGDSTGDSIAVPEFQLSLAVPQKTPHRYAQPSLPAEDCVRSQHSVIVLTDSCSDSVASAGPQPSPPRDLFAENSDFSKVVASPATTAATPSLFKKNSCDIDARTKLLVAQSNVASGNTLPENILCPLQSILFFNCEPVRTGSLLAALISRADKAFQFVIDVLWFCLFSEDQRDENLSNSAAGNGGHDSDSLESFAYLQDLCIVIFWISSEWQLPGFVVEPAHSSSNAGTASHSRQEVPVIDLEGGFTAALMSAAAACAVCVNKFARSAASASLSNTIPVLFSTSAKNSEPCSKAAFSKTPSSATGFVSAPAVSKSVVIASSSASFEWSNVAARWRAVRTELSRTPRMARSARDISSLRAAAAMLLDCVLVIMRRSSRGGATPPLLLRSLATFVTRNEIEYLVKADFSEHVHCRVAEWFTRMLPADAVIQRTLEMRRSLLWCLCVPLDPKGTCHALVAPGKHAALQRLRATVLRVLTILVVRQGEPARRFITESTQALAHAILLMYDAATYFNELLQTVSPSSVSGPHAKPSAGNAARFEKTRSPLSLSQPSKKGDRKSKSGDAFFVDPGFEMDVELSNIVSGLPAMPPAHVLWSPLLTRGHLQVLHAALQLLRALVASIAAENAPADCQQRSTHVFFSREASTCTEKSKSSSLSSSSLEKEKEDGTATKLATNGSNFQTGQFHDPNKTIEHVKRNARDLEAIDDSFSARSRATVGASKSSDFIFMPALPGDSSNSKLKNPSRGEADADTPNSTENSLLDNVEMLLAGCWRNAPTLPRYFLGSVLQTMLDCLSSAALRERLVVGGHPLAAGPLASLDRNPKLVVDGYAPSSACGGGTTSLAAPLSTSKFGCSTLERDGSGRIWMWSPDCLEQEAARQWLRVHGGALWQRSYELVLDFRSLLYPPQLPQQQHMDILTASQVPAAASSRNEDQN